MMTKKWIYPITLCLLVAALIVGVIVMFKPKQHTTVLPAAATNIERLSYLPLIMEGTVIDGGKGVNLLRDSDNPAKESLKGVSPGTLFKVVINEVYKGNVTPGDEVYVSVAGGTYNKKSSSLSVDLKTKNAYLFFLSESPASGSFYYVSILPSIFEEQSGTIEPVVNDQKFKDLFQDKGLARTDFLNKMSSAIKATANESVVMSE